MPWIIGGGVLVCCIGPIALIGGGGYIGLQATKPIVGCTIAMTGISRALQDYTKANGGKLPSAATWQTDIAPYYDKMLKNESAGPFTIPTSTEPFGCGEGSSKTSFAFNAAYAGKKLSEIKNPDDVILVFETTGTPQMNKSGSYKDLGKAASPKIFGQPRGWFALNADFDTLSIEDGRQKPMGRPGGMR